MTSFMKKVQLENNLCKISLFYILQLLWILTISPISLLSMFGFPLGLNSYGRVILGSWSRIGIFDLLHEINIIKMNELIQIKISQKYYKTVIYFELFGK